jgi:hypothetical protein
VHNCLVDSGASSNIMPYSVCLQINAKPQKSAIQIVQLDRTRVKVLGELKDVLIRLSSNSKVFQIIDIIVVDIPDAYGLILSRDWSEKLHGYFSTDWSHLWLPYNGKPNQICVNREKYMKHNVTDLDGENEHVDFANSIVGNYSIDSYFGNFNVQVSPF